MGLRDRGVVGGYTYLKHVEELVRTGDDTSKPLIIHQPKSHKGLSAHATT